MPKQISQAPVASKEERIKYEIFRIAGRLETALRDVREASDKLSHANDELMLLQNAYLRLEAATKE